MSSRHAAARCAAADAARARPPPAAAARGLLLAALLSLSLCAPAAADSAAAAAPAPAPALDFEVTFVATTAELMAAFDANSSHILITEHLDLEGVPFQNTDLGSGTGAAFSSFEAVSYTHLTLPTTPYV